MRRQRVERGIYRQDNGTYGVYLVVGGKPRYKTVGAKLAEARRQRDLLSAKAQRGELPPPSRITFGELAESWMLWGALTRFRVGWAGSDPWSLRPSRWTMVTLSGRSTSQFFGVIRPVAEA